jgi:hypothetical protein
MLFKTSFIAVSIVFFILSGCSQGVSSGSSSSGSIFPAYDTPLSVATYTDPAYTGIAYQSKFVPPDGKILLIGGQDIENIVDLVASWGITPGGFASYMAVSVTNGIWDTNYSGGDPTLANNAKWMADTYTNTVIQLAMWMVGPVMGGGIDYCSNTINHQYDSVLDSLALFAKTVKVPIYLRIGYEFDGPHNALEPASYVACFQYIVDYLRVTNGASNIAFVWHSYLAPAYKGLSVTNWYPGDNYVDWFAGTFFGQVLDGGYSPYLDAFVNLARDHKKPFMIAESCPIWEPGGTVDGIYSNKYETWNRWFVPYFNYIKKKNIKAFSYICCDWDKTQMFGTANNHNTRIQDYPRILEQWTNEISQDIYLKQSSGLYSQLGYTN